MDELTNTILHIDHRNHHPSIITTIHQSSIITTINYLHQMARPSNQHPLAAQVIAVNLRLIISSPVKSLLSLALSLAPSIALSWSLSLAPSLLVFSTCTASQSRALSLRPLETGCPRHVRFEWPQFKQSLHCFCFRDHWPFEYVSYEAYRLVCG
jgi:hypothetical protein